MNNNPKNYPEPTTFASLLFPDEMCDGNIFYKESPYWDYRRIYLKIVDRYVEEVLKYSSPIYQTVVYKNSLYVEFESQFNEPQIVIPHDDIETYIETVLKFEDDES